MSMTLEQWDKEIRPFLRKIEWGARCLTSDVRGLASRPEWETFAEVELAEAEQALRIALARVQRARTIYRAKQVLQERAA